MKKARFALGIAAALALAAPATVASAATPNDEATCVGLASAFFGQQGVRDDVAHAIAERFGIPPGAEVSRFAHVQLGDTAACIANGQG
jgi:hypothetical protein